jgi:hypothetical protein
VAQAIEGLADVTDSVDHEGKGFSRFRSGTRLILGRFAEVESAPVELIFNHQALKPVQQTLPS